MSLSDSDIDEFRQLYKEVKGEDIDFVTAQREATRLYNFYKAIYRPIPKNWELSKRKGDS